MLQTILKYKLRQAYNSLAHSPIQKKLEWLVPLVLIPYFVTLIQAMTKMYQTAYEISGWQKLTEIAIGNMAIIFFFVFVSTLVLTLYRLFQSKDIPLYISLPTKDTTLFGIKVTEAIEDTLRGIILPLPVIIAFATVTARNFSPFHTILFLLGWIIIIFQIASLCIAFGLILGKFVTSTRWSYLLRIIAVLSALAIILIFMRYYQTSSLDTVPVPFLNIESDNLFFAFFPATWLINFVYNAQFSNGALFFAVTIAYPAIAYYLFKLRFRQLWMEAMEISQRGKSQYIKSSNYRQMGSMQAFLIKELIIIKRDPHLLIGLFVPIIMFPAFVLFKDQQQQTQVLYITLVSFLGTVAYTLSSIGREGKTLVLLRSLPIKISVILRAKFLLSLMLNLTVTIAFIVIFSLTRGLDANMVLRNMLIGFIASVFFSCLGIALASIFPRLDFTNPMRAIAVPGLYSFYIISMLFIATMMLLSYTNWIFMLLAMVFWFAIAAFLLRLGIKKLEKMDV